MAGRHGANRTAARKAPPSFTKAGGRARTAAGATPLNVAAVSSLTQIVERDRRAGVGHYGVSTTSLSTGANMEETEEVTLISRTPGSHSTRARASAGSFTPVPVLSPDAAVLAFWHRLCGPENLPHYLANCGVGDIDVQVASARDNGSRAAADTASSHRLSQMAIFEAEEDRIVTALAAAEALFHLLDVRKETTAAAGAPIPGKACWMEQHRVLEAEQLAALIEAAVPLRRPSLLQADIFGDCGHGTEHINRNNYVFRVSYPDGDGPHSNEPTDDALCLVPSPCSHMNVCQRLVSLRRLVELRESYRVHLPRLNGVRTVDELRHQWFFHDKAISTTVGQLRQLYCTSDGPGVHGLDYDHAAHRRHAMAKEKLSSFLGSPLMLDTVLPLVGVTARHPHETALLQSITQLAKADSTMEAEAWGPMAALSSWRCSDGLYVVHHATRVQVLRRVLAEAQFYGLPRFLRSIRAMGAGEELSVTGITSPAASAYAGGTIRLPTEVDAEWRSAAALRRAQSQHPDAFFITPDALDPTAFTQPDAMQMQLVNEELITLQRTHCAFGVLIGEADRIAALMQCHHRQVGRDWTNLVLKKELAEATAVKTEEEIGNSPVGAGVDPLQRYALRTVEAARRQEKTKKAAIAAEVNATTTSAKSSAPFVHLQWVQSSVMNRWSTKTPYYALVYMVVLESDEWETERASLLTEGLLPSTAIPVEDATDVNGLRPQRPLAFCVNAVLELRHS